MAEATTDPITVEPPAKKAKTTGWEGYTMNVSEALMKDMEGTHFVAGPWFTVRKSGERWSSLGGVWISDGEKECQGTVEIQVSLQGS